MSIDAAGNYLFEVEGQQYRVMKMDYFQQCYLTGLIEKLDDPFSVAGIAAQKDIFMHIQWKDGADSWVFLDEFNLTKMMSKTKGGSLRNGMKLLEVITAGLSEAFTDTGAENPQQNSSPQPEEKSMQANTGSPGLLSQTINQSRQT